nr:MAG TPA: hypothetical protein [Herelleviridae sp.]
MRSRGPGNRLPAVAVLRALINVPHPGFNERII